MLDQVYIAKTSHTYFATSSKVKAPYYNNYDKTHHAHFTLNKIYLSIKLTSGVKFTALFAQIGVLPRLPSSNFNRTYL